ncbi:MAG TPA: ABC transporter ATP-binding protein [Trueperaceae bacterium]|nr:ABC transporter ATP-binding protein [Trueperaceae bacterium]
MTVRTDTPNNQAEDVDARRSSTVELRALVKRFGRDVLAVSDVDLHIGRGELVTLLGPSGCGKTTILRIIAGLERPSEGTILLDDDDVTKLPAYLRDVTMVFQSYALFPHMSVFENVAYGLRVARVPQDEVKRRVAEGLDMVGLGHLGERSTTALSGGQQQRVALARSLVIQPRVLLFDEPLSNLDAKLRKRVRDDIRELQQRLGITSVYVTHDQEEALAISDRVVVIREGVIEQVGSPHELYSRPASRFVADFIGSANFLKGSYDGRIVDVLGYAVEHQQDLPHGPVTVMVRPEAVEFAREDEPGLAATYRSSAYLGPTTEYVFDVDGSELFATMSGGGLSEARRGDEVRLRLKPAGLSLLPPE